MEKLPHPLNEMGEPHVPQEPDVCPEEICPRFETQDCRRDRHHLYYPKSAYAEGMEKLFRGQFQIEMCRPVHEAWHQTYEAPPKPSAGFMEGYVRASGINIPVSVKKGRK